MGRKKKYQTAKALREAVDAYFASISYPVPAVVSTPTGEVDDDGRVKWKTKMLTERFDGGKPKTVTKYLEPPGLAGLCLHLGISRETWAQYGRDEALGPVVEYARLRVEAYWNGRLDGKGAHGARFALGSGFGWHGAWKEKQEISLDRETRRAVTASGMTMEEKRGLLEAAAKDFAGDGPLPPAAAGTSPTSGEGLGAGDDGR